MDTEFDQLLDRYADLAVRVGVNIQPGQWLRLAVPIQAADLARRIIRKAYEAGAKDVEVVWGDGPSQRLRLSYAPQASLAEFPQWKVHEAEAILAAGAAFLTVQAPDPDLLADVDPQRIGAARRAGQIAMAEFSGKLLNTASWCGITAATPQWAARVLPDLAGEDGVRELWRRIFAATRIDQPDPVAAWARHTADLAARSKRLANLQLRALHYRAPGTDLHVRLPDGHRWARVPETNAHGVPYVPNIPSEEVFTAPLKTGVDGVVTATKPLNYAGALIEDFRFTFKAGRVVDFAARRGQDVLESILKTDENAPYLGEAALVPHSSPISQSGLLYYDTLYDENASCHLALGRIIPFCIEDGRELTPQQFEERGLNLSAVHVDFMIGSGELDIDGETASGAVVPIFRAGEWAF